MHVGDVAWCVGSLVPGMVVGAVGGQFVCGCCGGCYGVSLVDGVVGGAVWCGVVDAMVGVRHCGGWCSGWLVRIWVLW